MVHVKELENALGQMASSGCLVLMKIKLLALSDLFAASLYWLVIEFDAIDLFEELSGQLEGEEDIELIAIA